MSLPRQIPPSRHSPSPSKPSIRRPSGNHGSTPRSLLPSPHFEEPLPSSPHQSTAHIQDVARSETAVEDGSAELEEHSQLRPFFTLISDTVSGEHHHPSVHYIFADDDEDIITAAALRSLQDTEVTHSRDGNDEEQTAASQDTQHHYIILDVAPGADGSGYEVVNAQSFSPDWQVLQTNISSAPTFEDGEEESEDVLMLRIEGCGPIFEAVQRKESKGNVRQDNSTAHLEQLVETFQSRLADLHLAVRSHTQVLERPESGLIED